MTDVDLEVESDLEENLTEEDRNEAANVFAKKVEIIGGPPAGPATLEAKDACAWFGDRLVLEGVDLVMPKGALSGGTANGMGAIDVQSAVTETAGDRLRGEAGA